jgi:CRISPR-associated protein Cas2
MLFYVISYDISCDKRRKKVSDILESYGHRVQYSVFECYLTKKKLKQLKKQLKRLINIAEDSLRFYPLSEHTFSQVEIWGEPALTKPPTSLIV